MKDSNTVMFDGINDQGFVKTRPLKVYKYSDLPNNVVGKSLKEVGLFECVHVPQSIGINKEEWITFNTEVKQRMMELDAEIIWLALPNQRENEELTFELTFIPKR